MRIVLFLFIGTIYLNASTISLDEILQEMKLEHPVAKSIQAYKDAYREQNRATSSRSALQFSAKGAYAEPNAENSGYEYGVGLQQTLRNPGVQANQFRSARYQSDAQILEQRHTFMLLENNVRLLYHISCLDQKAIKQYRTSYEAFKTLYKKKEKAYEYGEISKKELLQLGIELKRLKNEYKHYENEEKISRNNLQSKILLPLYADKTLSCEDTYPINESLNFESAKESLKEQSLNKKIQSAQSDFKRFDTMFDSFTLSASYEEELDTNRFIIGLSMPLNFTNAINEKSRAAALSKTSALEYEKEGLVLERTSETTRLKKQLVQHFQDIEILTSMLKQYEDELMPLIEKGYRLGEDSAIEYLLSKREMWRFKEDLIMHYKNYYETLFKLYSVLEMKE